MVGLSVFKWKMICRYILQSDCDMFIMLLPLRGVCCFLFLPKALPLGWLIVGLSGRLTYLYFTAHQLWQQTATGGADDTMAWKANILLAQGNALGNVVSILPRPERAKPLIGQYISLVIFIFVYATTVSCFCPYGAFVVSYFLTQGVAIGLTDCWPFRPSSPTSISPLISLGSKRSRASVRRRIWFLHFWMS